MSLLDVRRDGDLLLMGLARPEKHNALDLSMVEEIHAALDSVRGTPCVIVIHSTTPEMFVSGADIAELRRRTSRDALSGINAELFEKLSKHRWPTIAAVDGPAIGGGCELALACDFRLATPRARFGQPEPQLGILAGAGANWRLAQAVGLPLARRMLLAGEFLDAHQALEAGLVDRLHSPDELLGAAIEYGRRIARASWQALELTKLALRVGRPNATLEFDLAAQAVLFESDEKVTRMDAFLEKKTRRG